MAVRYHIRWMIRRDMPEVLAIEERSFDHPWDEHNFIRTLRVANCIGMVVEEAGHRDYSPLRGYMIYELHKQRLHVLNFAVHPEHRRQGVGRAMVAKLAGKLTDDRRTRVLVEIRETNTPAQLFFRAAGFRAISVLRNFYEDAAEDAYLFTARACRTFPCQPREQRDHEHEGETQFPLCGDRGRGNA